VDDERRAQARKWLPGELITTTLRFIREITELCVAAASSSNGTPGFQAIVE
jgi:hypothetical protein